MKRFISTQHEITAPVEKVSKESFLLTMDNHLAHHRGQLIVYLRLMGLKPPSYVGW